MDRNRTDALTRVLNETQPWVDFASTNRWQKLKEKIENEIINPAREAFHAVDIDQLTDDKVLRHTLTQRAVVRTALKVIDLVEGNILKNSQVQKELERIEKHKPSAGAQSSTTTKQES